LRFATTQQRKELSNDTFRKLSLLVSIEAFDEEIVIDRKVPTSHLEDGTSRVMQEIGCQVLVTGIAGLDRQLRKKVPEGWRNVGTEERSVLSSLGWVRYQRSIYRDEDADVGNRSMIFGDRTLCQG
jgi:hypothetical protein